MATSFKLGTLHVAITEAGAAEIWEHDGDAPLATARTPEAAHAIVNALREPLSPAKAPRTRSLVRIALDLALESRERMEAELIAARERIEALEREVRDLQLCASNSQDWFDDELEDLRAEQRRAAERGEPVPQIGMTVDGHIGFIADPAPTAHTNPGADAPSPDRGGHPMSAVATPVALPQRRLVTLNSPDRFDLLGADGSVLPAGSTDYAAFVDHLTGLVFGRTLPKRLDQPDAAEACDKLELLGFTDWRVPTRAELVPLLADGASEPATYAPISADTDHEWSFWTSSPVPGDEDCFFVVLFDSGYVDYNHRAHHRWVRPVRSLSLPSGQ